MELARLYVSYRRDRERERERERERQTDRKETIGEKDEKWK